MYTNLMFMEISDLTICNVINVCSDITIGYVSSGQRTLGSSKNKDLPKYDADEGTN